MRDHLTRLLNEIPPIRNYWEYAERVEEAWRHTQMAGPDAPPIHEARAWALVAVISEYEEQHPELQTNRRLQ